MPVRVTRSRHSSSVSRTAAAATCSPRSTNPPGNTHFPMRGSIVRLRRTMPPSTVQIVQAATFGSR